MRSPDTTGLHTPRPPNASPSQGPTTGSVWHQLRALRVLRLRGLRGHLEQDLADRLVAIIDRLLAVRLRLDGSRSALKVVQYCQQLLDYVCRRRVLVPGRARWGFRRQRAEASRASFAVPWCRGAVVSLPCVPPSLSSSLPVCARPPWPHTPTHPIPRCLSDRHTAARAKLCITPLFSLYTQPHLGRNAFVRAHTQPTSTRVLRVDVRLSLSLRPYHEAVANGTTQGHAPRTPACTRFQP